ncbi:MAG: hypothetical protein SPI65_06710 [Peptoniphilus sp.]|nr:hypothetical protein [Peptoniphilus sp.]MDY6045246.1 hypothetical protein [Peptoniphilus sp.]
MRIKEIKIPYAGLYYHYLPWYDRENITFLDIARTLDLVFRLLQDELSTVDRNLYLDTAVEALSIYQRDLGLDIANGASVEERRKIIQGYLHYLHTQTTEQVVRDFCKSFEDKDTVIDIQKDEDIDTYLIIAEMYEDSRHSPTDLINLLFKILPAHLYLKFRAILKHFLTLVDSHTNWFSPLYKTGTELWHSGQIYNQASMGELMQEEIILDSNTQIPEQHVYVTNEIYTGEVANDTR